MAVRTIEVRERVMAENDRIAGAVRRRLAAAGVPALNLLSSPGAGKTTLLERTLERLGGALDVALVAGDVHTHNDADRLARLTDRVVHGVVTNGACHLDARQIRTALDAIDLDATDLLIVENVGNLVCPASWDLGETARVVLFSVTEGEDKPDKYRKAFQLAHVAVVTKIDLLPHLSFDLDLALDTMRRVNPDLQVFLTSARTGEGLDAWCAYLSGHVAGAPCR